MRGRTSSPALCCSSPAASCRRGARRSRPRRSGRSPPRERCSRTARRRATTTRHVHARARGGAADEARPSSRRRRSIDARRRVIATTERALAIGSRTSPATRAGALVEQRLDARLERAGGVREMKTVFSVALGIIAAIGGFVDIGDIVFNVAAGATFGYQLLWAVVVGVGGIITYAEMCGRVAAVSEARSSTRCASGWGSRSGSSRSSAGQLVNLLTLAAEIGGIALALQLLAGLPYRALLVLAVVALALVLWAMPFELDRARLRLRRPLPARLRRRGDQAPPGLGRVAHGFVPSSAARADIASTRYYVVGLVGAAMIPYEVYFYSSGAVEERWTPKDLGINRANVLIGYSLGGLLSFALMISARRAAAAEGDHRRAARHDRARRAGAARDDRADPRARRHAVRGRPGRRSTPRSRARTTSRSSSAGSGASTGTTPARRASRSPGS